ncbi:hypothetical protein [Nonomuraea pusilla]|uniref:Uncharacterized protein n=1 Tax=Nonomuraea pusilla TaxID=46177 RepID=A0A1H8CTK8_9ACTN|nr:hypothetical protein [Nonomuraea pusilla]SEM98336.1 hypothetical protein SAMN05660976_06529 [Nonomuraea pusilla]
MEAVTEVLSALIPPLVVGGAFIFGVVKLLRAEGFGRGANRRRQAENPELIRQSGESPQG